MFLSSNFQGSSYIFMFLSIMLCGKMYSLFGGEFEWGDMAFVHFLFMWLVLELEIVPPPQKKAEGFFSIPAILMSQCLVASPTWIAAGTKDISSVTTIVLVWLQIMMLSLWLESVLVFIYCFVAFHSPTGWHLCRSCLKLVSLQVWHCH